MYQIIIDGQPWADSRGCQTFSLAELQIAARIAQDQGYEDAEIQKLGC